MDCGSLPSRCPLADLEDVCAGVYGDSLLEAHNPNILSISDDSTSNGTTILVERSTTVLALGLSHITIFANDG